MTQKVSLKTQILVGLVAMAATMTAIQPAKSAAPTEVERPAGLGAKVIAERVSEAD